MMKGRTWERPNDLAHRQKRISSEYPDGAVHRRDADLHYFHGRGQDHTALAHNPKTFAWTGDIFYEHLPDRAVAYNAMADARIQLNSEYMFRRLDPAVPHLVYERDGGRTISQKPVDANAIPKFEERALPLGKALQKALAGFAILIGFNILLFIFVYGAFHVYDVR